MIRSKTTLIVGAGAGAELDLPDERELLNRIAQAFDFARLGTDLQTLEMVKLAEHFEAFSKKVNTTAEDLKRASQHIRAAARVGTSIDPILEQFGHDPQVLAAGKLAVAYFTLQAEARSPMARAPRELGDLPLRGSESWLFQFARLVTSGVPRRLAEHCFDNLSVVSFNYDRSLQHYLPFVLEMAFGMSLDEARELVGERLDIVQPYGTPGRLPWEPDESPAAEWGEEEPESLAHLAGEIRTASESRRDKEFVADLRARLTGSDRICFLGYGFDPQSMDFLLGPQPLDNEPDIMIAMAGLGLSERDAVERAVRRRMTSERPELVTMLNMRSFQFLREYAVYLES